jgi:hypothetical protein
MRTRLLCRALLLLCLLSPGLARGAHLQAVVIATPNQPLTPIAPAVISSPYTLYLPHVAVPHSFAIQQSETIYLPLILSTVNTSDRLVAVVPVAGPPVDRPAAVNPDLNLALRDSIRTDAPLTLVDYGGETDDDAPQLAGLFDPPRLPSFVAASQVYDWNWGCGPDGCRGEPIAWPPVTLLALRAAADEPIHLPTRRAEIYPGGFVVLVLYADATRVTLKYGREDSPATGYLVHLEALRVDPAIVRRYREMNDAGRDMLPALCNGDRVGWAVNNQVRVAVRDTGSFLDPRSRKDWWQGWGAAHVLQMR